LVGGFFIIATWWMCKGAKCNIIKSKARLHNNIIRSNATQQQEQHGTTMRSSCVAQGAWGCITATSLQGHHTSK